MIARFAAAALLLAGGCPDLVGPESLHTTLEYRPAPPGEPAFAVSPSSGGSIAVDGRYGVSGCPRVTGTARRDVREVILRVRTTRQEADCPVALHTEGYHVVISGLNAGTYHLRVEHYGTEDLGVIPGYPGGDTPLRYEQDVTLP